MSPSPAPPRCAGSLIRAARTRSSRKEKHDPVLGNSLRSRTLTPFRSASFSTPARWCTRGSRARPHRTSSPACTRRAPILGSTRSSRSIEDSIVGFAHVWAQGPDEVKLFARTHPDARGRGIGGRLLSLCDQRAAELLPAAPRTTTTWAADASAPALLEAGGYRPIRYFVKMEIAAGLGLP